jgi:hypothetical protein
MDASGVAKRLGPPRAINPIQLFLSRAARLFHPPDSWAEIAARIRGSILFFRPASTNTLPNPCGTFASSWFGSIAVNVLTFSSEARLEICSPNANANMAQVLISSFFPANPHFGKLLFVKAKGAIGESYRRMLPRQKVQGFAPLPLARSNRSRSRRLTIRAGGNGVSLSSQMKDPLLFPCQLRTEN